MKAMLHFNLEDETDKEKHRCAMKGYRMSGMIDSFLDYLAIQETYIHAVKKKPTAEEMFDHMYAMYCSKIVEFELQDMVNDDVRYLLDEFCGEEEVDLEQAEWEKK